MGNVLEKSIRVGPKGILINHPDPRKDEFLLLEQRFFLHKSGGCLRRISHLDFYNKIINWVPIDRCFVVAGNELKFVYQNIRKGEILIQPGGFFVDNHGELVRLTRKEFFCSAHRDLRTIPTLTLYENYGTEDERELNTMKFSSFAAMAAAMGGMGFFQHEEGIWNNGRIWAIFQ